MKIYLIKHDVERFKFYLQNEHDPLSVKAFSFEGESLIENWVPFSINLFEGKTKKEKSLREDFNASCFDDGLLYVTPNIAECLCSFTKSFEKLKVLTDNGNEFYYMNLTKKLPSLLYNDKKEIQNMYRTGIYKFDKAIVESELFFRDSILPTNYYFTERFLDKVVCDIKGVYFKEAGEV